MNRRQFLASIATAVPALSAVKASMGEPVTEDTVVTNAQAFGENAFTVSADDGWEDIYSFVIRVSDAYGERVYTGKLDY